MARKTLQFDTPYESFIWMVMGVSRNKLELPEVMNAVDTIERRIAKLGFDDSYFKVTVDYSFYKIEFYNASEKINRTYSINGQEDVIELVYFFNGTWQVETLVDLS